MTDADHVERFRKFLRIVDQSPRTDDGRYVVSPETMRYVRGEDVDPTFLDPERPTP